MAIAVIALLFLIGCMSGIWVKRMADAGARRHRRGHARIHGLKRQTRDRGHGGGNHGGGLFPGSGTGASLDRADRLYAAHTRQAALETRPGGVPSRWHNPNTGNAGAITPTRTDRSASGIYCREYQLTVTAGEHTGQAHGGA